MQIAILGAGIAGLSTACFLKKQRVHSFTLFEESDAVGGMASTFVWHGFPCDPVNAVEVVAKFFPGRSAQFAHQDVDEIYAGAKNVVADILARA